jgi:hypothetical protein
MHNYAGRNAVARPGARSDTGSVDQGKQVRPERAWHEMKAAALVGRRMLQVGYWDIHNCAADSATWDYGDWHRAVMGVDLLTDAGPSCVLWTDTFYPYGVEVFPTPVSDHIAHPGDGSKSHDASRSDRWQVRLGSPVRDVQTFWERLRIGPPYVGSLPIADAIEVDVPVSLRLDFSAGPVWMIAGIPQAPQMQEVFVPGDEIMVVFTADRMRQIGFPDSEFLTAS